MSCDSTDRRRVHNHTQTKRREPEGLSGACVCDCAVVESLKYDKHPDPLPPRHTGNLIRIDRHRDS